jgi:hypothetical protein
MKKGKKPAKTNGRTRGKQHLPPEAIERLNQAISDLGDPALQAETRARFCYLYYGSQSLCRLGYRGELNEWDFAIYRSTIGKYSNGDYFLPSRAPIDECIRTALSFYNLR